jgi:hypothetical protein
LFKVENDGYRVCRLQPRSDDNKGYIAFFQFQPNLRLYALEGNHAVGTAAAGDLKQALIFSGVIRLKRRNDADAPSGLLNHLRDDAEIKRFAGGSSLAPNHGMNTIIPAER